MKTDINRGFKFDPHHQPSERFKQELKKQVLMAYAPQERVNPMKKIYFVIPAVFASVALLAGMSLFLLKKDPAPTTTITQSPNQANSLKQVLIKPSYSTGSGGSASSSSLAGQTAAAPNYGTVESAAQAVGFEPFYPAKAILNEQLTELYSTQGLSGGNEKTLYMSFGTGQKLQYQILQTAVQEDNSAQIPPEVERVKLVVGGQSVTAMRNEFWNEKTPLQDIYPGTPRQTISFTYNGVAVDITEYGDLTLAQLQQVAANLAR